MDNLKKVANMTTIIVFVVAFLLGYGTSARIVNRNRASAPLPRETAQTDGANAGHALADISAATPADTSTTNSINADDQPAGTMMAVSVKTDKEAWAVIHEDADGKPGKILGAHLFPAGTHLGRIELLRGTEAGKKYYAMLHADDGDRAFAYETDLPLKNAAGNPVMHAFMATADTATQ